MRGRTCGLLAAALLASVPAVAAAQDAPPSDDRFEVTLLDKNITQGIRIETAARRPRAARRARRPPEALQAGDRDAPSIAGQIPTGTNGELGFVGLAAAPDFATTHHVYAHYVPTTPAYTIEPHHPRRRASRSPATRSTWPPRSRSTTSSTRPTRAAGTAPATSSSRPTATSTSRRATTPAAAPPSATRRWTSARARSPTTRRPPRPTRTTRTARSCASARSPTRARPSARAARTTIPAGNLFTGAEDGGGKTLREIYAMGLRNPFTIGNAKSNGELWFADYGPDATLADATRGPAGHVLDDPHDQARQLRLAVLLRAGPARTATGTTSRRAQRGFYDCDNLVNNSPNNLTPAASTFVNAGPAGHPGHHAADDVVDLQRRLAHDAVRGALRRRRDGRPALRVRRRATRRRRSSRSGSTTATSSSTGPRTGSRPRPSTATARVKDHKFFLPLHTFVKPMDMQFGADGSLYVLAYGNGWGANNDDTGLYRVTYAAGNRRPTVKASDRQGLGRHAADRQLRREPARPTPTVTRSPTAWDFTNDGTIDATGAKATHTYATAGSYVARADRHGLARRVLDPELPDRRGQHPPGREDRLARRRHAARDRPARQLPRLGDRRRGRRRRLHEGRC